MRCGLLMVNRFDSGLKDSFGGLSRVLALKERNFTVSVVPSTQACKWITETRGT